MAGMDRNSLITLVVSVTALGGAIVYAWWDKAQMGPPMHVQDGAPDGPLIQGEQPRPTPRDQGQDGQQRPMYTFDSNGDGQISLEEFTQGFDNPARPFEQWDLDSDGFITAQEQALVQSATESAAAAEVEEAAEVAEAAKVGDPPPENEGTNVTDSLLFRDVNGDGSYTTQEFTGDDELFQIIDHDKNGLINSAERHAYLSRSSKTKKAGKADPDREAEQKRKGGKGKQGGKGKAPEQ